MPDGPAARPASATAKPATRPASRAAAPWTSISPAAGSAPPRPASKRPAPVARAGFTGRPARRRTVACISGPASSSLSERTPSIFAILRRRAKSVPCARTVAAMAFTLHMFLLCSNGFQRRAEESSRLPGNLFLQSAVTRGRADFRARKAGNNGLYAGKRSVEPFMLQGPSVVVHSAYYFVPKGLKALKLPASSLLLSGQMTSHHFDHINRF